MTHFCSFRIELQEPLHVLKANSTVGIMGTHLASCFHLLWMITFVVCISLINEGPFFSLQESSKKNHYPPNIWYLSGIKPWQVFFSSKTDQATRFFLCRNFIERKAEIHSQILFSEENWWHNVIYACALLFISVILYIRKALHLQFESYEKVFKEKQKKWRKIYNKAT